MYRKDVLQAKGITMPDKPTWQQVADIAAKADGAQPNMKGICLRGQPGWGEVFAPLTTVVNTFGGTWFEKDWTAKVNAPEFKEPPTSTSTWSRRTARTAPPRRASPSA
jgi:sorbitol/mannitol transport system substrate-binding protein